MSRIVFDPEFRPEDGPARSARSAHSVHDVYKSLTAWFTGFVFVLFLNGVTDAADFRATLLDAQAQFEQSHYEQALKLYQQADDAEPGHAAVDYNVALCHLNLGDREKAIQRFESVASQSEINTTLRHDAFYNIGLIRAQDAREQLGQLLAPATQPTDHKPTPADPANIPKLQEIADDLLRAITAFREATDLARDEDTEHNIRAIRITRRDVLGLLQKATEAKEKEDILKDPRAYLEALLLEQERQISLIRLLMFSPPEDANQSRQARRAGLRAQRQLMERTGVFADHLAQFRETSAQPDQKVPTSAPGSQPTEETPRETVYHAAAKQIETAIQSQRDACAFMLDNQIAEAREKQSAARDEMYAALYMFPLDPGQALVKSRLDQAQLKDLVATFESTADWLRDPLIPEVEAPKEAREEPDKTPIHYRQTQIGKALALLHRQCQYLATTSQPAEEPQNAEQKNPLLDPELNQKLAATLEPAGGLIEQSLVGIVASDQKATLATQEELLKLIDAALDLLPKTIEQRITELIVWQGRLNADVQAQGGKPLSASPNAATQALDEVRKWATRFKSKLLGVKPGKMAESLRAEQKKIQADTVAVNDEVRQQIPSGLDAQAAPASPPDSQPSELNAHIEASKHLTEANTHMDAAIEGFEQTIVEESLKPIQPEGQVQTAQAKALEELVKALAALKPPATQPSGDQQDQQQKQQQQQQTDQSDQDKQREIERLERERERAEQELYQRRPRTVIKDW